MKVFQWYRDTFDLPGGAKLLYAGREVRNQVFRIGKAVGLQFHLEMTPELIERWLEDEKDLNDEEKDRILRESKLFIEESNRNCRKIVEAFLRL